MNPCGGESRENPGSYMRTRALTFALSAERSGSLAGVTRHRRQCERGAARGDGRGEGGLPTVRDVGVPLSQVSCFCERNPAKVTVDPPLTRHARWIYPGKRSPALVTESGQDAANGRPDGGEYPPP